MIKTVLHFIFEFFKKWVKENEEEIKEYLWELLISIVKTIRESRKG
ncbi:hypothetical protein V7112_05225 [Bacillus sp. JJ1566]